MGGEREAARRPVRCPSQPFSWLARSSVGKAGAGTLLGDRMSNFS